MLNTKSAVANLINRYKAVLKKCHLLNTFGSLALAASLVCGGAGIACAATDSAYTLEGDISSAVGYYADFTVYSVDSNANTSSKYELKETQYGVKLNDEYAPNDETEATIQAIVESYLKNYVSTNHTTITYGSGVCSITYKEKDGTSKTSEFSAINSSSVSARKAYTTTLIPSNIEDNFANITNGAKSDNSGGPWNSFNGGAVSVASQVANQAVSVASITGDFIDNSIADLTSYTKAGKATSVNSVYKNNGGAIGLFTDKTGASVNVAIIKGDFIGNEAHRVGGAIYLFTNNNSITKVETITGDFIANTAGSGGGAIANYEGDIGVINDSTFIGNVATAGGGAAIDNMMWSKVGDHKAKIGDITGTFIGNRTGDTTTKGDGGAIRNFAYSYSGTTTTNGYASIGDITANFIGNEASGDGGALYNYAHSKDTVVSGGGEVSNTASIVSVSGDFIGNIAGGSGGAIYNDDNLKSTASIGKITGDFINNTSGVLGGAIYNTSVIGQVVSQKIENGNITGRIIYGTSADIAIKGDFINNKINGASDGIAIGGAIYNNANDGTASIGKIQGDFIGNIADAKLGLGGAIANYAGAVGTKATIGDIEGDFIGNTSTRYGGAIYNDSFELGSAIIGTLTGDFINNSVNEASGATSTHATAKAQGGAIYNNDTIGTISGSFIGNFASSNSTNVVINGGAIYTTANMNFKADGKTQYFSDNYTKDNTGTVDYNAIYVDIDNIISGQTNNIALDFNMSGTGNVVMNDSISGNTEYTPLTNTDYGTKIDPLDTATFSAVPSGTTDTIVTIGYGGTSRPVGSVAVTGAKETISEVTTTKVVENKTVDSVTTTTTTTTIATTPYTSGNPATTTYASTIIVTDDADNIISVDTNTSNAVSGLIPNTTTTTTTFTVKEGSNTATYTETGGTVTNAKVEIEESDQTITTTTYTKSGTVSAVLVSDADTTTDMDGATAYDINIKGGSNANTFYLRDEVTQFGDFNIEKATLHLGAYTHADGTKTVGKLIAIDKDSSVTFGANSQLTIDMSAYADCMTSDSSISDKAVLTGHSSATPSKGANLIIESTSKLRLENVHSGSTFTILKGFDAVDGTKVTIQEDAVGNYAAWTIDNVSVDSDLLAITILRDGYNDTETNVVLGSAEPTSGDDVYYVISIVKSDDSPLFDTSVGDIVSSAAKDKLFGSDSAAAGDRYYYDISTIPDDHDEKTTAEGTANMAKVSGVPTTTFRVNRLSSDALSSRGDFGGGAEAGGVAELSKKNESTALWAIPMYGHDVTDGASVADYGADYHTNIYGGVVGIDKTIDSANALGANQYRVGVALNMGGGDTKSSGHFSNVNSDFNFGGAFVYGIAKYGDFTLSADAGFNKIFSEMNQDLSKHGIAGTEADVQSHAWSVDLSGEYRIATDVVDITPYVGLELVSMKTEDYAVKRSDAAGGTLYNIESERQNIVSLPVGVKFDAEWTMQDSWTLTPQLSIGAIFAMGDLDEHSSISMPDVAGSGQTSIQVVDEVTLDMAVGVSIANDVWTIGLDYELQKSEHRTGHGLTGLVQYKF